MMTSRFIATWVLAAAAIGLAIGLASPIAAAEPRPAVSLDALAFLIGNWTGEGKSDSGPGTGSASFERTMGGKAILRRNHAEYPASGGRPAVVHDDLMIVYADAQAGTLRAFYTDTESHVIDYVVTPAADGKSVVFESDPSTTRGPRFRLTFLREEGGRVSLVFEMAPPDHPDQFSKLMDGRLRHGSAPHRARSGSRRPVD